MKERNKTRVAGALSVVASIITLIIYGLLALATLGYIIFVITIIGGIANSAGGSSSNVGLAGVKIVLIILAFFAPMIVVGILGCIFGSKMKRMGFVDDGKFYFSKKRLITYDVFLYIFALICIVMGIYGVIGGTGAWEGDGGVIAAIAKIPFSLISGALYLISAILLSVDIEKNKQNFKLAKEGKLTIPGVAPVQAQVQQPVKPEIITLKKGEEIPEHLKGRLVPVEPKDEDKKEDDK